MDAAPRVSVIVRTKDRPRLLGEALESLRAQTFQDFEVVVVNDGGRPPEGLAPAGRGLVVVETEPPRGRAKALNTGLKAARGPLVAYLDDDDLWLPDHLEALHGFLAGAEGYGGAFSGAQVVLQHLEEDGRYRDIRTLGVYAEPFVRARLLSSNTIPLISLMHERERALAIGGFDEAFDLFEDWDFLIRFTETTRLHLVPGVSAIYRLRDDGSNATTETPWRSAGSDTARVQVLKKHWSLHGPETQAALVDLHAAREEALRGELQQAREATRTEAAASAALREEIARLTAALEGIRAERDAERSRVREAEELVRLVRADAARQLQAAGEREGAQARRADDAEGRLDAVHRSLAWRLFTPWWKVKALLTR